MDDLSTATLKWGWPEERKLENSSRWSYRGRFQTYFDQSDRILLRLTHLSTQEFLSVLFEEMRKKLLHANTNYEVIIDLKQEEFRRLIIQ